MLRYLLTILLINTYSGCFGGPVPKPYNGTISSLLDSLASQCPNQFVVTRIKDKLEECKMPFDPSYPNEQFLCLMFYDINKQLCDASKARQLAVDDSAKKMNEVLVLATACDQAKSWAASDIDELPEYKKNFEIVFHSSIQCPQVCAPSSILNPDVNFYCKYFKWGLDVLSVNVTSEKVPEKMPNSILVPVKSIPNLAASDDTKPEILNPTNQAVQETTKDTNSIATNITQADPIITKVPLVKPTAAETKIPVVQTDAAMHQTGHKDQISSNDVQKVDTKNPTQITDKSLHQPPSVSPSSNDIEVQSGQEAEPPRLNPKDDDVTIKTENSSPQKQDKPALNEPDNVPEYGDDASEADDDDGVPIGNDTDIDGVENDPKFLPKPNSPPEPRNRDRSLIPEEIIDTSQYETDDDHFFPFFLTGVISVIVLYVLYHNKSKVTKVVLGLIVEGRQPGRRRNSRGHAYKRLDTLEQAMSTNSAAPPSKIIY
ncbi:hypothetical protein NE865_03449 [Phthorimaea operculella]|nr:hypothetical protein NE865_03449 [Phthorimaea operculella]